MKRASYRVLAAVVAVAVLTMGSPQSQAQQLGNFSVGHTTRLLNVRGTLGEERPLNVHLWYPARGSEPMALSLYTSRLYGIPLLPQWDPLSWTIGSSVSFENLPIDTGHGPYPVIIFSHGNLSIAIANVYTLEALASFGFIVVAPDHLNNTLDDALIDFINAQANSTVIPCFDSLPSPCLRGDLAKSMTDRAHDISAVIDVLPIWFGDRVDMSRLGVMGASRGSITALAAAGGSTTWGFSPDPRVKAIMPVTLGRPSVTLGANLQDVTVPALLVGGTLDNASPPADVQTYFAMLASTEKELVLIEDAMHRHFASGLCAATQSAGAVAAANPRAVLDLRTFSALVMDITPPLGIAMDICGFETFTTPSDIRPLVASLTGFNFTTTPVPTTGLEGTDVMEKVVRLAVNFFGSVLRQ